VWCRKRRDWREEDRKKEVGAAELTANGSFVLYNMIEILFSFFSSLKSDLLNVCCQLVLILIIYFITVLLAGMLDAAK